MKSNIQTNVAHSMHMRDERLRNAANSMEMSSETNTFAGPQLQSRSQRALPDLNREFQISVGTAQPGAPELSGWGPAVPMSERMSE